MAETSSSSTPNDARIFHMVVLWMLSMALEKLTKHITSGAWYFWHFSIMPLNVNTCSTHNHFSQNPAHFSWSWLSTTLHLLFRIIWQYTFSGTDSNANPLQLSKSSGLPFLQMQTMVPFFQSSGTVPNIQTWLHRLHIHCPIVSPMAFIISALILSMLAALLFLRVFMAFLTSSSLNLSVHIVKEENVSCTLYRYIMGSYSVP